FFVRHRDGADSLAGFDRPHSRASHAADLVLATARPRPDGRFQRCQRHGLGAPGPEYSQLHLSRRGLRRKGVSNFGGSATRDQFQINVVTDEALITLSAANISLDPTHRYRLVMTAAASTLTAHIYDFSDLTAPLVTISADDETYSSGVAGLFASSRVGSAEY